MIAEIITSMRPYQWYKNLILLVSIVFSLNILNIDAWYTTILAFIIFCGLSGSEYIINDIIDINRDRVHPIKCKRPIAAGKLNKNSALIFTLILIIVCLISSYLINVSFLLVSISYLLLILSYSLFLKHFVIVDLIIISMGFVLRAVAGGVALNIKISPWLIVCTLFIAMFLALGKRRYELNSLGNNATTHRKNLGEYSNEIIDQMINITTSILIIAYSLYTFFVEAYIMMITIPVIVYGLFRYIFLIQSKNYGGEPEMIFKDKGMILCIVLWILLIIGILYINIISEIIETGITS